jgi:hypothetical protein
MTYYSDDRAKNYSRKESVRLYRELSTLLHLEVDELYLVTSETSDLWIDIAFMDVVLEREEE